MSALPNNINYSEVINSLPENTTKYSVSLQPVNGSTFGAGGQQIIFQFANRGFLDPNSICLKYRGTVTNAVATTYMLGSPVFTPYQRLEVQIGSQTVDSINNFNQVANLLVNTTMSVSDKYGQQSAYGWSMDTTVSTPLAQGTVGIPSLEQLDGRLIPIGIDYFSVAAVLPCLLTNCDKMLPLFAMPTISLILTTDALTNMYASATNLTAFSLSNFELTYDFIDFGSEIEAICRGMGPKIFIKSQSFSQSAVTIPVASNGSQSIIFNQRYASVKAAFVMFSGAVNNKTFESVDISNGTGTYSICVSGVTYPQRSYDAVNAKGGILQELRRCVGSLYDSRNSMSINAAEWNVMDNVANNNFNQPGKFILGFNLEKYHGNTLLSGISTNNSNISVNINQSVQTAVIRTCSLILGFDALIEVDMVNRQASVKV